NVKITLHAMNTMANVNVRLDSAETIVFNHVTRPRVLCSDHLVCDSLADGPNRHPRPDDQTSCQCKEGWSGINCNLCQTDEACAPLMPDGINGTCYKGGMTVKENFQMCQVINRKIIDQLNPQVPEVTFSCNKKDSTCAFQCMFTCIAWLTLFSLG